MLGRINIALLAVAEGPDTTDSNLTIVVIAILIVAGVCILAAIPVVTARRRSGRTEGIGAAIIVWSLLLAGSAIYAVNAQMAYAKERTMRIMQNFDPRDQSDRPAQPWVLWSVLGVGYIGAIAWSMTARPIPGPPRGFDVVPTSAPKDPTG